MEMSVRERILTIRLLEKISADPTLAEAFVAAGPERKVISWIESEN